MGPKTKAVLVGCTLIAVALWVGNTSQFTAPDEGTVPKLIAHRGLYHVYAGDDRSNNTCRAPSVEPITHPYVENTLASMRAAFEAGADVVELDVHLTADNVFAVFHDWRLECQTNGEGVTEEQPFSYLKTLDVAYNLSSDGTAFPLRGQGVGMMPSLSEVFEAGLSGQLLINFKSRRTEEGAALAKRLAQAEHRSQVFAVYGGGPPTRAALEAVPGLKGFDKRLLKTCFKDYLLMGWTGRVPESCSNRLIAVPLNIGPFLWGWPHRFTQRLRDAGTDVILWGPYDGSGFSSGIDDAATLARVPTGFDGYLWTNKIELIGPMLAGR